MQFSCKIDSARLHVPKTQKTHVSDWESLQLCVGVEYGHIHFALKPGETKELQKPGFERIAIQVLIETIDALNRLAAEYGQGAKTVSEVDVVRDLSEVYFEPVAVRIDDLPGWVGAVERIDAEKMLQRRQNGTYLLRSAPPATQAIAFHLAEENRIDVKAYLCTVVESHQKIADILLLDTEKGWTTYQDNPNLLAPIYQYHANIQALLHALHGRAKHPL